MKIRFIAILLFLILGSLCVKSQNDTTIIKQHNPKKATFYAAVLPGMGQIYNKKYWKLPIVYGAFGTVGYYVHANNKLYNQYKTAYKYRTDDNPLTIDDYVGTYTDENLQVLSDFYRRNLELSVIASFAVYALSILDATVDAHLFDFQVNDDLSFRFEPTVIKTTFLNKPVSGFKLTFNF